MKKTIRGLCAALALAILLCGALAETDAATPSDAVSDFSPAGLETPEEICTAAMEVYSWFALQPLDVDLTMPDSTMTRYRVLDERLNTPEKMTAVLHEYFSEEIVEALMTCGVYAEEDGYLYTGAEQTRPIDPTIVSTEYYLAEETEITRSYNAAVFYSDEEGSETVTALEEYTLYMENIDGKWLFTSFWFFW